MLKRNAIATVLITFYTLVPFSAVAAAEITSANCGLDESSALVCTYTDASGNQITDPAQITAYQLVRNGNVNTGVDQAQLAGLIQGGDVVATIGVGESGAVVTPTTLKGSLGLTPPGSGFSQNLTGIDPKSDLGRLTYAVQNLGVRSWDINTNPNTKNLPPDVRQAVAQGIQGVEAYQAAQNSGGGFFSFAGDFLASPIGRLGLTVALTVAAGPAGAAYGAAEGTSVAALYGLGPAVSSVTAAIAVNEVTQEVVLCATGITCGNGTNGGSNAVSNTPGGTPDLCPNIPGVQTSIPPGYALDSAGNCVPEATVSGPTWSLWSACSGACGGGSGTQTRSCSSGNATDCTGPASQSCTNTTACTGTPTWSSWSACSGACGGGTGTQSRSCSTGNSADCTGPDTQVCANTVACPSAPSTPGSSAQTTTITPPQSQVCIAQDLCAGSTIVHRSSACTDSVVQSCDYGCLSGSCKAPPSIAFSTFSATNPASGSFSATGHLQVRPTLVHSGDPVWLYWSVVNASSCTVTGTNGDSWSGPSSGPAGKQTSGIVGQTIYTLACTALSGATPPSIRESQTVNITPYFQER